MAEQADNGAAAKAEEEVKSLRLTLPGAIKGLAGLAALAVYVQLVGGAVMWARYHSAGIPEMQTITALPPEFLLVIGISALLVPVAIGIGAAVLQYVISPENETGVLPSGFCFVLLLLAGLGVVMAVWIVDDLATWARVTLAAGAVLGAVAVWLVARRSSKFVSLALLFFLFGALYGGAFKVVRELSINPRFDLAVVFRGEERRPAAGLYLARTSDDVLIAREAPDRRREWQTIVIPKDQVTTLVFGPRGLAATRHSQQRADELLRQLKKARLDKVRKKAQQAQGQGTAGSGAAGEGG